MNERQKEILDLLNYSGGWLQVGISEMIDPDFKKLEEDGLIGCYWNDGGYRAFITDDGRAASGKGSFSEGA